MIAAKLKELNAKIISPLTDTQLRSLEIKVNFLLPPSYRWMLSNYGGLTLPDVFYQDPQLKSLVRFGWFFDFDELVDALESYAEAIPIEMIPIGEDGGGNLYCLGIQGGNRGKVFFHDHNIGWHSDADESDHDDASRIRAQTVYELSSSLEDFVESMVHLT
jgi:hypothetical protein